MPNGRHLNLVAAQGFATFLKLLDEGAGSVTIANKEDAKVLSGVTINQDRSIDLYDTVVEAAAFLGAKLGRE